MNRRISGVGFTLIELLIVISIIIVLMGLITVVIPQIQEVIARHKTVSNLNQLKQALLEYRSSPLPEDTKYDNNKADNSHIVDALKDFGVKKELLKDGWGRDIYYDRLRDVEGMLEINRELPGDPVAIEHPSDDMPDDEKRQIVWDFVIWSLGPDAGDVTDDISERGMKLR